MVLAAGLLEMTQIRADLLRHGAKQADVQRACHGFVNLAQP